MSSEVQPTLVVDGKTICRKPDLKKVRFVTIEGGIITPFTLGLMTFVNPKMSAVFFGWSSANGCQRETPLRVLHEVRVGTIDELVEEYRCKLTTAVESVTGDVLWQASGDDFQKALDERGIVSGSGNPYLSASKEHDVVKSARQAARLEDPAAPTPSQHLDVRDSVRALVIAFNGRWPHADSPFSMQLDDSLAAAQHLQVALEAYIVDKQAEEAHLATNCNR